MKSEMTILQEALQDERNPESRSLIRAGIARLRELDRICAADTTPLVAMPMSCAWCNAEAGIPQGAGSHGICARHAEQVVEQARIRKLARQALVA